MMMRQIYSIILVLLMAGCDRPKDDYVLSYENNVVHIQQSHGHLMYSIHRDGRPVIEPSDLGIIVNDDTLGRNVQIEQIEEREIEFSYPLKGVKNRGTYQGSLHRFVVKEADSYTWHLEFQLSSEGVAYRYLVPGDDVQKVNGELSSFTLPQNTRVWYFERNSDWKLKSHAGEWLVADVSQMPTVSKMGPVQGLTITAELPQGDYLLLAEAALFNYSGMRLEAVGNNTFQANFTEGKEGFEIDGNIQTPWRCLLLADDLNDLVNNTMVASLNPAPNDRLFSDQSWIKPGKSVWHWWSGKFVDFEEEKDMIDDAVKLGFSYNMVDDGWKEWKNKWQRMAELCRYGEERGIGLFVWKHSKEINFPENDYAVMQEYLDSVMEAGAVGIKVDFMNGQSKALIDFDEALLRYAAERKLMVNFHGCQQSSGEYRTYPNEVTREGIRGLEVNHMKEGPLPASHNAALPFTRYVTGHGDYTPLGFSEPGETTWAHQLGTLICFYSPFTCIAENTQLLLNSKLIAGALDFIKEVPVVWDETVVMPQSKIGELAVIARRSGTDWYLGVLFSGKAKKITVDCSFLPKGSYEIELFSDDLEAQKVSLVGLNEEANLRQFATAVPFKKEMLQYPHNGSLEINVATNGGAAIWFKSSDDLRRR